MITKVLGEIVVVESERKLTMRVEIDNSVKPPSVRMIRARQKLKGDGISESSTYPLEFSFTPEIASRTFEVNGKTISAADVYGFIRELGDAMDPIVDEKPSE